LDKYNKKMNARARPAEGVMDKLVAYDFPGNVRELENLVEQSVALCTGGIITVDDVLPDVPRKAGRAAGSNLIPSRA
jgi:two-component system response regulator HydG